MLTFRQRQADISRDLHSCSFFLIVRITKTVLKPQTTYKATHKKRTQNKKTRAVGGT